MRMGKLGKRERIGKGYPTGKTKPKLTAKGTVIGSVSSNLINSIYLPLFQNILLYELEVYLAAQIEYEEAMSLLSASQEDAKEAEAEVDADGGVVVNDTESSLIPPVPLVPPVFASKIAIDDFTETMEEIAKHFSKGGGWKVHANAAKFERILDEKYGIFRPFIANHPEVEQFIRYVQRQNAMGHFSPFRQTPPPIPRSTAIIILFMMQGKVPWPILILAVLFFLVGLQPWALVCLTIILHYFLQKRKTRAVGKMEDTPTIQSYHRYYKPDNNNNNKKDKDEKDHKQSILLKPVGSIFDPSLQIDMDEYDTLIVGYGLSSLYTAALLSRAGQKVLVAHPFEDASGCMTLRHCKDPSVNQKFLNVPFDIECFNVARVSRQQELLVPALCSTTDYQGGIRFAQIGSEADGYAFEILSIPGVGASKPKDCIPFVLRAQGGAMGLMDDTARFLGDGWPGSEPGEIGNSATGAYLTALAAMNADSSQFYLEKAVSDNLADLRNKNTYTEACIRFTARFLDECFPLNAHCRSLMAAIGMKGENIKPSRTSMGPHVTNICAAVSGEGLHYPIGGPRALCHALVSVIEQCGGKVLTEAPVQELVFDLPAEKPVSKNSKDPLEIPHPRCLGVRLLDGRELTFSKESPTSKKVLSTYSFIDTFIRCMPNDMRTSYKTPRGLPALVERRPVMKFLFALDGTAEDLDITGADFYRLPAAALAKDEANPETGAVTFGEIGASVDANQTAEENEQGLTEVVNAPSAESSVQQATQRKVKGSGKTKFYTGTSWIHVAFPSAKDPSFTDRHGPISTCVVTVEADDDFAIQFDSKPKIFAVLKGKAGRSDEALRLLERVRRDLVGTFPQLEEKILHAEARGPCTLGLSHTPERYAARGIHTKSTFPGLFMGGSDLTVGDSFAGEMVSGWLAANSIIGYKTIDHLYLNKNITTDLNRYIEEPEEDDDDNEDLAVPYSPPAAVDSQAAGEVKETVV